MSIHSNIKLPSSHPFVNMDIPGLMSRLAGRHAARTLMIWEPFEGASRCWTYGQAYSDIRRIATFLKDRGVVAGDAVILHLENSPESVLAWFACAQIGAVAVSTNARCAGEELAYFADKSGAVGIISQPKFGAMIEEYLPDIGWKALSQQGDDSLLGASEADPGEFGPEHPLCIQFTSGTTSRPKAVLWTHANGLWGAMVNARHFQLQRDDVALVTNPLFHTVALAWQLLGSLWVGASIVLQPKFSASRFWDIAVRHGCTWTTMSSFHSRAMIDQQIPANHRLRFNCGGASFTAPDMFFGVDSFGSYGMTELITQPVFNDPLSILDEGAMGRPAPEYEIRIAREDDTAAAFGESGELLVKGVRGLSIFAEYLDDPSTTAACFTPDGFFRTGDLVSTRADGAIVLGDRLKDMLKIGGENVAASEIERVIRDVPGVREVAVVGMPHVMLQEVAVAFVIPDPGSDKDLASMITDSCTRRLADFKVPRGVHIVDSLPRSFEFKVSKVELRRRLAEGMSA
ncbi:crotonobetaine/carnitine-CoA ligase [Sphingobium faniae]|nr:crotonobetaine/carnitine-CoA ligase [Sphingobium faniae]